MAEKQSALAMALQKFISPNSVVGKVSSDDAYRQHVLQASENGQQPMSYEQYQATRVKGS